MAFYRCNNCRRRECNLHIPFEVTEPKAVLKSLHCPVSGKQEDCEFALVDYQEYGCKENGEFDCEDSCYCACDREG